MKSFKEIQLIYQQDLSLLYDKDEITALLKNVVRHYTNTLSNSFITISDTTAEQILLTLNQLRTGKPLQHILGKAHFYNLEFVVNKHTLIPRPETEELVDLIIRKHQHQKVNILDIGTGSGCISIALKKHLDLAKVSSLDISIDALAIARENAILNNVDVAFHHADALNLDSQQFPKYDIILSNPPYIKLNEKPHMHQNVLDFEPHLALFVDDQDPLIFYDKISDFALTHLVDDGFLYFEINQYLAKETKDLLIGKGFNAEVMKDINSNDRFVIAKLSAFHLTSC